MNIDDDFQLAWPDAASGRTSAPSAPVRPAPPRQTPAAPQPVPTPSERGRGAPGVTTPRSTGGTVRSVLRLRSTTESDDRVEPSPDPVIRQLQQDVAALRQELDALRRTVEGR